MAADAINAPVLLIASDERIRRYRHPIAKPKPIDTSLMLITCAEAGGLMVAITRFAWLRAAGPGDHASLRGGEPPAPAFLAATRPGRRLAAVLEDGIAAYREVGFPDEWLLHHQGGPIGYQGREAVATPGNETRVNEDMAFAWNPSITGVKAEDTFIVRPTGTTRS